MKMEQQLDEVMSIDVELVFKGEPPTVLFLDTIRICEEEIHQSQRAEMEAALEALNLPGSTKSACRRRFAETTGVSLRFTESGSGSIVLTAGLTALAFWIIKITVGETIKEAYKETGMHDRLKKFLLARVQKQTNDLECALSSRLVRYVSDAPANASIEVVPDGDRYVVRVMVTLNPEWEQGLPPTVRSWLLSEG